MLALYDLMHEISSRLWVILKLEMVDLGYLEMIKDFPLKKTHFLQL